MLQPNQAISKLRSDIANLIYIFKKEKLKQKKNYLNSINISDFIAYLSFNQNTISTSNINLVWNNNIFSLTFLNDVKVYNYDHIISSIIPFLLGDFSNMTYPIISTKYDRIVCTFTIPITSTCKIIVGLYFIKGDTDTEAKEVIEFIPISSEIQKVRNELIERLELLNTPKIEFDSQAASLSINMMFKKIKEDSTTHLKIYYPFESIEIRSNKVLQNEIIGGHNYELFNDYNDFVDKSEKNSLLEEIENSQIDWSIKEMIDNDKWVLNYQIKNVVLFFKKNLLCFQEDLVLEKLLLS